MKKILMLAAAVFLFGCGGSSDRSPAEPATGAGGGQTGKSVDVQVAPRFGFLADRVNDGVSEQKLESDQWTHVILQAEKYSSTRSNSYPTTAPPTPLILHKKIPATMCGYSLKWI